MKYGIYRNLKNGKLSIMNTSRLVVGYCDYLQLTDAEFRVSKPGVKRIRRKKQKHVCAVVWGTITVLKGFEAFKDRRIEMDEAAFKPVDGEQVKFNPYLYDYFYKSGCRKVNTAEYVYIDFTGFMSAINTN